MADLTTYDHFLTHKLDEHHFYKCSYRYFNKEFGLWIGFVVDPKSDIILDCKWHSDQNLPFNSELIHFVSYVIGLTYSNYLTKIPSISTELKSLLEKCLEMNSSSKPS